MRFQWPEQSTGKYKEYRKNTVYSQETVFYRPVRQYLSIAGSIKGYMVVMESFRFVKRIELICVSSTVTSTSKAVLFNVISEV